MDRCGLPPNALINAVGGRRAAGRSANDPAAQTITISGQQTPLIAVGQMNAATTSTAVPSVSPSMDEIEGFGTDDQFFHYKIYNAGSSPANHSYDMGDSGINIMQSGFFTFG